MDYALSLVNDGILSVDDEGRIWRQAIKGAKGIKPIEPRRAEHLSKRGYLDVVLAIPGSNRTTKIKAHRLVYEVKVGPIPEDRQINHKDLNKANNWLDNLEVVTQAQNIQHSYANGRTKPFALVRAGLPPRKDAPRRWPAQIWQGRSLITPEQRAEAVRLRTEGMLLKDIAARLGISITHAHRITSGGLHVQ